MRIIGQSTNDASGHTHLQVELVLDLEATGLPRHDPNITEFGFFEVQYAQSTNNGRFYSLINGARGAPLKLMAKWRS